MPVNQRSDVFISWWRIRENTLWIWRILVQNLRASFNWIQIIQQKSCSKIHLQSKGDSKSSFISDTKWKGCWKKLRFITTKKCIVHISRIHGENFSSKFSSKICNCHLSWQVIFLWSRWIKNTNKQLEETVNWRMASEKGNYLYKKASKNVSAIEM